MLKLTRMGTGPSAVYKRGALPGGMLIRVSFQRLTSPAAGCAVSGDFDGDGDLDVVIGADAFYLMRNDGTGQFVLAPVNHAASFGDKVAKLASGDFDGDGDLDIVAVNGGLGFDYLWQNDGSGAFSLLGGYFDGEGNGFSVVTGDFDEDGDLDIIIGNGSINTLPNETLLFTNNGSGSFTRSVILGSDKAWAITAADLNNDGDLDLFVGLDGPNQVWRKGAGGLFNDTGQAAGGALRTQNVLLEDFDNDGDLDAFCSNSTFDELLFNVGSNTFSTSFVFVNGSFNSPGAVAIDADQDGDLDLWKGAGNGFEAEDQLYLNDGAGAFTQAANFPARNTEAVLKGDFDGDGLEDVFIASGNGNHALYSRTGDPIVNWAKAAGLSGPDTLPYEDPDGDTVLNWQEFAFNMNPAVADKHDLAPGGDSGLPTIQVDKVGTQHRFTGMAIRPVGISTLTYKIEDGYNLSMGNYRLQAVGSGTAVSTTHKRVEVQIWSQPTEPLLFGRMIVTFTP